MNRCCRGPFFGEGELKGEVVILTQKIEAKSGNEFLSGHCLMAMPFGFVPTEMVLVTA